MSRIERYKAHGICMCAPHTREDEDKTKQGLSYSPSDMARLAERGIPVNNINTQTAYFDGTKDATYFVGDERMRGVDVADLWEKQQVLREKARKAALASKRSKSQ